MGLFGGLIGSIFGGGSTNVSQTATNQTRVDVGVDVNNTIDLSALGLALDAFGQNVTGLVQQMGNDTNSILNALFSGNEADRKIKAAEVLVLLNGQQLQQSEAEKRTEVLTKTARILLLSGGSYAAYRFYKGLK